METCQSARGQVRTWEDHAGERLRTPRAVQCKACYQYLFLHCLEERGSWDARIVLLVWRAQLQMARTSVSPPQSPASSLQDQSTIFFRINVHRQDRCRRRKLVDGSRTVASRAVKRDLSGIGGFLPWNGGLLVGSGIGWIWGGHTHP